MYDIRFKWICPLSCLIKEPREHSHVPNPASATEKWLPESTLRKLDEIRGFRLTLTLTLT